MFVANPNNPTGTWLDENALRAFVQKIPENVLVVIDEAGLALDTRLRDCRHILRRDTAKPS